MFFSEGTQRKCHLVQLAIDRADERRMRLRMEKDTARDFPNAMVLPSWSPMIRWCLLKPSVDLRPCRIPKTVALASIVGIPSTLLNFVEISPLQRSWSSISFGISWKYGFFSSNS